MHVFCANQRGLPCSSSSISLSVCRTPQGSFRRPVLPSVYNVSPYKPVIHPRPSLGSSLDPSNMDLIDTYTQLIVILPPRPRPYCPIKYLIISALRSCVEEENHELRPVWMSPFQHNCGGVYAVQVDFRGSNTATPSDERMSIFRRTMR